MSLTRTPEATLSHWRGPFYPEHDLQALNESYGKWAVREYRTTFLVQVATSCRRGYVHPCLVHTEDGYLWRCGLVFRVLRSGQLIAGRALILFPDCKDERKRDGSSMDRSIALYANSAVNSEELAALLKHYHLAFCETQLELAASPLIDDWQEEPLLRPM